MVAATIFLALAFSLGALAWVLWPLLDRAPAPVVVEDDRLVDMIGRKEAVVEAIRDLEFDYRVGKLSEEDYQRYDQRLRRQAIVFMQQIEQMAPASTEMEATIEAEIARHRRVQDGRNVPSSVAAQVAAVPAIATAAKVATSQVATSFTPPVAATAPAQVSPRTNRSTLRFCTNCGHALEPQHKFCANCGTPVVSNQ